MCDVDGWRLLALTLLTAGCVEDRQPRFEADAFDGGVLTMDSGVVVSDLGEDLAADGEVGVRDATVASDAPSDCQIGVGNIETSIDVDRVYASPDGTSGTFSMQVFCIEGSPGGVEFSWTGVGIATGVRINFYEQFFVDDDPSAGGLMDYNDTPGAVAWITGPADDYRVVGHIRARLEVDRYVTVSTAPLIITLE